MKFRALSLVLVLAVLAGLFGLPTPAKAVAYGATFTTSITYMNIGVGAADVSMLFYAENTSSPIAWSEPSLPEKSAASLWAGSVFGSTFSGSVVISSSANLAVTAVQTSGTVKNRMLSNGFSGGGATFTIPTVLKNTFSTNSVFSVQNADIDPADVTVTFNPVTGSPFTDTVSNLPVGAAKFYDMGAFAIPGGATSFNGSVSIASVKHGTLTPGSVVAASQELNLVNDNVYAFEGVTNGGPTVYMPSAFCNWSASGVNSAYAVMNMGTDPVNLTVVYNGGGTDTTATNLQPGKKVSILGCTSNTAGYIGSAVITAVNASGVSTPSIVAIGKITGGGLSTAYSGVGDGAATVALPYVRYTTTGWTTGAKQRVFIAIQNVGAASLAIGDVAVDFYDANGVKVGTLTNTAAIAVGGKWSVNASQLPGGVGAEFGYGAKTGGGAIVNGPVGSKLAVIGRAQTYLSPTTATGEDYNAIPVQ